MIVRWSLYNRVSTVKLNRANTSFISKDSSYQKILKSKDYYTDLPDIPFPYNFAEELSGILLLVNAVVVYGCTLPLWPLAKGPSLNVYVMASSRNGNSFTSDAAVSLVISFGLVA